MDKALYLPIVHLVSCLAFAAAQDEPTTARTTTPFPGVQYGSYCNGLLLKCNTYGGTVACLFRQMNETLGYETCEQGAGVDIGKCQCQRNCRVGAPS